MPASPSSNRAASGSSSRPAEPVPERERFRANELSGTPMTLDEAFTRQPSLATDRLLLRPLRLADAEAVFAFKSDPEVTRHYGQEPHRTLDETRAWIQRREVDFAHRTTLFWAFVPKGEDLAVGAGCLWNFDPTHHTAEVGYELHRSRWGQGIMTEALSAILECAFADLGLHRVEANPLAGNAASVRLLVRLGFREEGRLRARVFFRGRFEDQLYFGILRDEWRPVR